MWRGLDILTVAILVVVLFVHAGPMRINQYRMRAAVKLLCRRGTNAPMFAFGGTWMRLGLASSAAALIYLGPRLTLHSSLPFATSFFAQIHMLSC